MLPAQTDPPGGASLGQPPPEMIELGDAQTAATHSCVSEAQQIREVRPSRPVIEPAK
jgi:hypothetical protein